MFVGFTTCSYSVVKIHGTCQCNVISRDTGLHFIIISIIITIITMWARKKYIRYIN